MIKQFGDLTNKVEVEDFVASQQAVGIEFDNLDGYGDFKHFHFAATSRTFHSIPHRLTDGYAIFSAEKTLLPIALVGLLVLSRYRGRLSLPILGS